MSIFKCKMCGGALEINNNETVATCEYCGTQQTLPKLDDDRRANMYDRANHFRRNNEFDKAIGIYEQILNEDNTDAEAYWSLVLCRYGIEYVEDPATRKRVPTINRAQFTSIFDDDNYKSALHYADDYQKSIYEEEANAINKIQKGILAISQKEEPFDIFICYKETDHNGRRTPDSVLANDLYHQLTQEGFKVFFSRITLEDKLGSAYEPYIFAALNSAKVMVVLGTKSEYFNAAWVKNEWSRYLALIKQGQNKMLIPAYKDMDPYDLPEEFSHLQAQDMSKLGFMQDLIRGIKKIIVAPDRTKSSTQEKTVITANNSSTIPLLKRVFLFLEDGDWRSADEYCEKVLDIDPENAEAYLGKLMAELRIKTKNELRNCEPYDMNINYQKVLRFADSQLSKQMQENIAFIYRRKEEERMEVIYCKSKDVLIDPQSTPLMLRSTSREFKEISEYLDSAELAQKCLKKAEEIENARFYDDAKEYIERAEAFYSPAEYEKAIELLQKIEDFRDAKELLETCKIKQSEMREEQKRIKKRNINIAIITTPIVCLSIIFALVLNVIIIPNGKYNDAVALMDAGKYDEALSVFEALDGYKDSEDKIPECQYNHALNLIEMGKHKESLELFQKILGYRDSTQYASKFQICHDKVVQLLSDDEARTYEFVYDSKGLLIKETETNENFVHVYEYTYDNKGKVVKYERTTGGDTDIFEYTYDSKDNLIKETCTDSEGDISTYEGKYDSKGNMIERTYTSDSFIENYKFEYDDKGNCIRKIEKNPVGALYTYESSYDEKGNKLTEIRKDSEGKVVSIYRYTYDKKDLLQKEEYANSEGERSVIEYKNDDKGNVLTKTEKDSEGNVFTWEYTYDSNGNVIKRLYTDSDGNTSWIKYRYQGNYVKYDPVVF